MVGSRVADGLHLKNVELFTVGSIVMRGNDCSKRSQHFKEVSLFANALIHSEIQTVHNKLTVSPPIKLSLSCTTNVSLFTSL
jgi:hypothetical protein